MNDTHYIIKVEYKSFYLTSTWNFTGFIRRNDFNINFEDTLYTFKF